MHGARVEVDEQDLAVGQERDARLDRRRAGARVEGVEGVVGLGGGQQLPAADLDGAELAAHERLAADTRPLARSMIGWKCGRMRPWERNSGNQSVRARSSSVHAGSGSAVRVGEAHGEQPGALRLRAACRAAP